MHDTHSGLHVFSPDSQQEQIRYGSTVTHITQKDSSYKCTLSDVYVNKKIKIDTQQLVQTNVYMKGSNVVTVSEEKQCVWLGQRLGRLTEGLLAH